MEGRLVVFIKVLFSATVVIAKPTWEDVQDPASTGKFAVQSDWAVNFVFVSRRLGLIGER